MNLQAVSNLLPATLPVGNGFHKEVEIVRGHIHPSLVLGGNELLPHAFEYQVAAVKMLKENRWDSKRVFVTSPAAGDGKTSTAFNMAWALSRFEKSVLLVELNFGRPQFRSLLGDVRIRFGVDSALRGSARPGECVFSVGSDFLHIAAVRDSTRMGEMEKLLPHLHDFEQWAEENYDLVIFDCPSVVSKDWQRWFHRFVGSTLLVVREQQTAIVDVDKAVERLGAHLKGVLLNSYSSEDYLKVVPGVSSRK